MEAIIVKSSGHTFMRRMIAVRNHRNQKKKIFWTFLLFWNHRSQKKKLTWTFLLYMNHLQVKDAVVEIIKVEDVALLRNLAMKERVTVMDLVMEVVMMAIQDAKENYCVEAIIVEGSGHTSMRRMIVVRNLNFFPMDIAKLSPSVSSAGLS